MSTQKTKNPVAGLPVRLPGQSIHNRILDIIFDKFLYLGVCSFVFTGAAYFLWIDHLWPQTKMYLVTTISAVLAIGVTIVKVRALIPELRNLRQGRSGERYVAQYLEEKLRPYGWQIVNDIPGKDFNVDHVIIGPSGVYTIETKTISKPQKGKAVVVYDGQSLTVNGHTPDRNPVEQALSQSRWLGNLIEESTGQRFKVNPVVIYPKWFVRSISRSPAVHVQNETFFVKFLTSQPNTMTDTDVHLITYHLKRYVIAKTQEEDAKR
jgi:hypothetical protein